MAMVVSFRVVLGWPGRYRPWRHPGGNPHRGPGEPASPEEDEDRNLHLVLDPPDREGRRYALNRPTGMRSSHVAPTALASDRAGSISRLACRHRGQRAWCSLSVQARLVWQVSSSMGCLSLTSAERLGCGFSSPATRDV